ncbi:MAG: def [Actinomycetia bacterium]|nr:def [Actinomycetes bacterium]
MTVRTVLELPDRSLKTLTRPVGTIGATERRLAADLLETMAVSPACVGLAANQLGVHLRAFCVDVTGHRKADSCHGPFVLFDPVVLEARAPVMMREGCMSVPDLTGDVSRSSEVVVRGTTPEGRQLTVEANAFEARAVLHEIDHLDGFLFLDRVAHAHGVHRRRRYT